MTAAPGPARSPAAAAFSARALQAVLLAYVAAVAAFSREFAHLHAVVAGVPVFSGELTLAALGALAAAWLLAVRRRPRRADGVAAAVALFIAIGGAHAAVGLARGFGLAALRDFALTYYALFFLLALVCLAAGGSPAALAAAFAAGATAGGALALARLVASPALDWGHGVPGHQALIAWVAVLVAVVPPPPTSASGRAARALVVAVNAAVVLLSGYRTMLLVFAGVAAAGGLGLARFRRPGLRRALAAALAGLAAWGAVVAAVALSPRPPGWPLQSHGALPLGRALYLIAARWAVVEPGAARPASWRERGPAAAAATPAEERTGRPAPAAKVVTPPGSKSVGFRLLAWRNAVERIRSAPLAGIGFGPAPQLHPDRHCQLLGLPVSNCGNAHNTYLTVAMRMGLPVLLGLLLLNGIVVVRALRALLTAADVASETTLVLALAALVSFALYAATSLFLESPYLSSLYWIVLALTHRAAASAPATCAPESLGPEPPAA